MVPNPCNSGGHGGAPKAFSVCDWSQNRERQRFPAPAGPAATTAAEGWTNRGLLVVPVRWSRRWTRNRWGSHVSARAQVLAPTRRSWLGGGWGVSISWRVRVTRISGSFLSLGPSPIFSYLRISDDRSQPPLPSAPDTQCASRAPNKIRSRILGVRNFHSLSSDSQKRITPTHSHTSQKLQLLILTAKPSTVS